MENIINITESTEIPQEIINKLSGINNLLINLEPDSLRPIKEFLILAKKSNVYIDINYRVNIDLSEENFNLFLFLVDCIEKAYLKIINVSDDNKTLFTDNFKWNISICFNIFFNYPFTLDDIIYLPLEYIEKCEFSNTPEKLIETLIHEKLHVSQRLNEFKWEKYIEIKDVNWIKLTPKNKLYHLIDEYVIKNPYKLIDTKQYEFVSNPDTWYENFKYIYNQKNKLLYGHYICEKKTKKIHKEYFVIDEQNNLMIKTTEFLEQEHPYEIYAYKISNELMFN